MQEPAPLLLLTQSTSHRCKPVYDAVKVFAPPPAAEEGWHGAVLGDTQRRLVRVVPALIELVQATTSHGWVWFEDGRRVPRLTDDPWATMVAGAPDRVSLLPPVSLALPAFVCRDESLRPCQHRVVVRFLVRTLSELPDTRVTLDMLTERFGPANAALVGHRAAAETLRPGPDLVLPVEIDASGRRMGAVLRIERRVDESICLCTLLLSDWFPALAPGTILRRRARQDTLHKAFASSADVGEVIDTGSASPLVTTTPPDPRDDVTPPQIPIVCLACGRRFQPRELSPDELEVADHWAFRVSFERELRSKNKRGPRADFLRERIAEYNALLAGRRVTCRHCSGGAVSFEPDWWEKF